MSVTDEQIAAYADGELQGADKARIADAIAADPALAQKLEAHKALKAKLGAHFAPILDAPVPDRLTALLHTQSDDADNSQDNQQDAPQDKSAEVVSFAAARQKRGMPPAMRRWLPVAGSALAASLVLAVILPSWQAGNGEGYAGAQLASALDNQLVATQTNDADTRILLSFENDQQQYCRAYRASESAGIACRDDKGWQIKEQFQIGESQSTEFRQAGSEAELLRAAQDMAAGIALDAQAEKAARDKNWQ